MNKKASSFSIEKIGAILLILIFLFLIFTGGSQLLWKAAKSPLKLIDSWLGTGFFGQEENLTDLNKKAQDNFDNLRNELYQCKSKTKDNCICSTLTSKGFKDFNLIHNLEIKDSSSELRLLIIKDKNELTARESTESFPTCYTTSGGISNSKLPLRIKFDEDNPYLEDAGFLSSKKELNKNKVFYKYNGQICWLTTEVPSGSNGECV